MNKNAISIDLAKCNDQEKNEYINDMVNAVHAYISSDQESALMQNFVLHTDEIRRRYDYLISLCEIQKQFEQLRKSFEEFQSSTRGSEKEENDFSKLIDEMESKIEEQFYSTVSFSRLNTLCEVYEKEEKKRRDRSEYQNLAAENPMLTEIALAVDKKRRVKYKEIKDEFKLSDPEMKKILKDGRNYFNLAKDKNHNIISISLNYRGKQYIRCVSSEARMVSQSKVDEIVVSNCESIILSMKASVIKEIPHDVKIVGVSPSSQRKVCHIYRQNVSELIKARSETYGYDIVYDIGHRDGGKRYELSKCRILI